MSCVFQGQLDTLGMWVNISTSHIFGIDEHKVNWSHYVEGDLWWSFMSTTQVFILSYLFNKYTTATYIYK